MRRAVPFLLGAAVAALVGLACQPDLPGHTHRDPLLRLAGCLGCAREFQSAVLSTGQRAQAAQVGSHGGAR